ncbi:uncharacterized protein LOC134842214 [Symsagittifera roscoffensis]|uniref:uncharacterized protein LOC134842214 n=1 Tax=Symsagittifera roscoffensis TaxID=84072 RepID=UPI00307C5676
MASYAQRGLTNEYSPNLQVNTHPDSDDSTFSDSEAEHAELLHGRHTVALDGRGEESEVQRGLYNRHDFAVNNFNLVIKLNAYNLRMKRKKMSRLLPFGGVRSRHLSSRFEKRNFQNLVALFIGWFCGMSPPLMMVIVAYSQTFWLDFFILYTMLSLMILHVICFVLFMRNMKMFIRSPFMVPVTITSQRLHGLHNNFDDLTPDVFADLSVATCLPDRILPDVIQYMALFDEDEKQVRVMFYSPQYFHNYFEVPRNRILQMSLFTTLCFTLSVILSARKMHILY